MKAYVNISVEGGICNIFRAVLTPGKLISLIKISLVKAQETNMAGLFSFKYKLSYLDLSEVPDSCVKDALMDTCRVH